MLTRMQCRTARRALTLRKSLPAACPSCRTLREHVRIIGRIRKAVAIQGARTCCGQSRRWWTGGSRGRCGAGSREGEGETNWQELDAPDVAASARMVDCQHKGVPLTACFARLDSPRGRMADKGKIPKVFLKSDPPRMFKAKARFRMLPGRVPWPGGSCSWSATTLRRGFGNPSGSQA